MGSALSFAFIAGVVSSVNPCGFALLPAYFARRLGTDTASVTDRIARLAQALSAGSATTVGFILIFGIVGGVLSLGAVWLTNSLPWAGFAIGILLTIIGLFVVAGRHVGIRLPTFGRMGSGSGLNGDFVFGVGYGAASLTCTLPVFLSVTGIAATGGISLSALSFVAYGLGMGTVLMAIAVTAALSQQGFARRIKSFIPYAHRFGGFVLILAGLYVIYYWGSVLLSSDITQTPGIIGAGETVSSTLTRWLGSSTGQNIAIVLLAVFMVSMTWGLWRRISMKASGQSSDVAANAPGRKG